MRDYDSEETLRRIERDRRRAELQRRRRRRRRQQQILLGVGSCLVLALLVTLAIRMRPGGKAEETEANEMTAITEGLAEGWNFPEERMKEDGTSEDEGSGDGQEDSAQTAGGVTPEDLPFASGYTADTTDSTRAIGGEGAQSTYGILIDLDNSTIVAQKNARDRINPASMTKILTLLVAAEHVTDLDDTFTITREITDYSYGNDCSAAGFDVDETVTVRDLMYGTILPSGADAAAGLAFYVSGSMEEFVALMNEKIEELGLSGSSHFTNCVGLYDADHYCTVYDMAIMLKAAVENELCREVLSAHIYTTSSTEQHPEGIEMSNWFLRRIEDKDTKGEVVCAKTGYVVQSGNCGASYEVTDSGKHYICVTADAHSAWRCIYDHVAIYQSYTE